MSDSPQFELSSTLPRSELNPSALPAEGEAAAAAPLPPSSGAPYYGVPTTSVVTDEIHLTDYLRVLYKRRRTAVSAFVVVFGSVALYTFTATPQYEARAQVLIENVNLNIVK